MSYAALAAECAEYSRSAGFAPTTWETLPIRLCAIHAEIGELDVAMRFFDVREVSLESADVAAYSLLILHDLGYDSWAQREIHVGPNVHSSASDKVSHLHAWVDKAFAYWRGDNRRDCLMSIELLIAQLVDLRTRCLKLPNSLDFDVRAKLAINRGRPHRHGGKNPNS